MTEDEIDEFKKATTFSNPDPKGPWLEVRLHNPFTEEVMEAISKQIAQKVLQKMLDFDRQKRNTE